jgi:molybdopterin synthase catalytic subunit
VLLVSGRRLEFKENSDAVVYFCGTIKNLSENNKILKHLASRNLEELLLKLFKELSKYVRKLTFKNLFFFIQIIKYFFKV